MFGFQAPHPRVVRSSLQALSLAKLRDLAALCGTPYQTLYNIRAGKTPNPRCGTVHAIAMAYEKVAVKPRSRSR